MTLAILHHSPPQFWRQSLSLALDSIRAAGLASQWIPGIYLSLPLPLRKPGSPLDFLRGVEDPPQPLVLRRQFTD